MRRAARWRRKDYRKEKFNFNKRGVLKTDF